MLKKRYLITGGAGFIGSNLIPMLLPHASEIRVVDNLSLGNIKSIKDFDINFIEGDICNSKVINNLIRGVDVVIHLAAHTRVIDSIENPKENFNSNVAATFNLLRASVENNVEKFVFASTGGAIIGDQQPPVHENMVPHPMSPYGASKLAGEGYCSAFYLSYGLPTVSLRFSNVYGPYSLKKGSVVAHFFKQIMKNEPLVVYGDGTQTRDYVFTEDLCNAIILAVKSKNSNGQVFQIGSGIETKLNDLIKSMERVIFPKKPEVLYEDFRKGEVYKNFADINKAKKMLGFYPRVSLEEGLERTWDWFLKR